MPKILYFPLPPPYNKAKTSPGYNPQYMHASASRPDASQARQTMGRPKIRELPPRYFWNLLAAILMAIVGFFWVSYHFVRPIPPKTLVMTTGMEGGAYAVLGERYRQVLARDGIRL